MNQEPLTLYKLIVLYLLNKVSFPLTMAQVSDLILEKEYTSYLTLQQVINDVCLDCVTDAVLKIGKGIALFPGNSKQS